MTLDRDTLEAAARVCKEHAKLCVSGGYAEKARTAATCADMILALAAQQEQNTAAGRICSSDGRPCPAALAGKGPGNSRCEQNGICQRMDFDKLPKVEFHDGTLSVKNTEGESPMTIDGNLTSIGGPAMPEQNAAGWEEDALRYCKNSGYWRSRARAAEAQVAALRDKAISFVQKVVEAAKASGYASESDRQLIRDIERQLAAARSGKEET